ncbi:putative double-stranded RNA/RNA-DNA hybrid binding protein [Ceratocystis lukuohia]|uniref:Double-stranded RNA/RNA-DNA hybrid binding protein n=1 Tax=Ceratocystis lukuohia TaxID=2019550 RepID=A0ABR4MG12_9PEZI
MATVGTLIAYSDGSKDAKGNAGAGWVTTMDGTTLETGHSALGKWVEVADAEAYGACEAAKRAVMHTDAEEIWICLDNQGVVDRLHNPQKRNSTSQDIIDRRNGGKGKKDIAHCRTFHAAPRSERRATKAWTERNWGTSWQPGRDMETSTNTMAASMHPLQPAERTRTHVDVQDFTKAVGPEVYGQATEKHKGQKEPGKPLGQRLPEKSPGHKAGPSKVIGVFRRGRVPATAVCPEEGSEDDIFQLPFRPEHAVVLVGRR